jgi:hypothetical protein
LSNPIHRAITAWRSRDWYDIPLALLGMALMLMGLSFYALVSWVGAPVMPYTGLAVAALGLWIGFLRKLWDVLRTGRGGASS